MYRFRTTQIVTTTPVLLCPTDRSDLLIIGSVANSRDIKLEMTYKYENEKPIMEHDTRKICLGHVQRNIY